MDTNCNWENGILAFPENDCRRYRLYWLTTHAIIDMHSANMMLILVSGAWCISYSSIVLTTMKVLLQHFAALSTSSHKAAIAPSSLFHTVAPLAIRCGHDLYNPCYNFHSLLHGSSYDGARPPHLHHVTVILYWRSHVCTEEPGRGPNQICNITTNNTQYWYDHALLYTETSFYTSCALQGVAAADDRCYTLLWVFLIKKFKMHPEQDQSPVDLMFHN